MARCATGLCLVTCAPRCTACQQPPTTTTRPGPRIQALHSVLPAVLCLQVWDLSTGAVRQTLERAHSGSEVPCITDLTVWEGHIVSASLDGLIAALRRPLRLDEALDVELWMLDPGGACLLVGPTLPPAAVLEAAGAPWQRR